METYIWFTFFAISMLINSVLTYTLRSGNILEDTLRQRKNEAKWLVWLVSLIVSISFLLYMVVDISDKMLIMFAIVQLCLLAYRYIKMPMTSKLFFPIYGIWTFILIGY